jgi:hypothetical protein
METDPLWRFTDGSGIDFVFDLSKIPFGAFGPIIKGIALRAGNEMHSLTFTCAYANDTPREFQNKMVISNSVVNHMDTFFSRIIRALRACAPTSRVLSVLKFSQLPPGTAHLSVLAKLLSECSSLKTVEFDRLALPDADVIAFFNELKPPRIPSLVFRGCPITDDIIGSASQLIRRIRRTIGSTATIDFIDTGLSEYGRSYIQRVLRGEPDEKAVDNPDMDTTYSASEGSDRSLPAPPPPGPHPTPNHFERDYRLFNLNSNTRKEALMAENIRLRVQIERMKRLIHGVSLGGLFVVGQDGDALINLIQQTDSRLDSLLQFPTQVFTPDSVSSAAAISPPSPAALSPISS